MPDRNSPMDVVFALLVLLSDAHDASQNFLPMLKLLDAVREGDPLTPRGERLGHEALQLGVWHIERYHGREDILEVPDNVALDDLGCNVGDERLLLYLFGSLITLAYVKDPDILIFKHQGKSQMVADEIHLEALRCSCGV